MTNLLHNPPKQITLNFTNYRVEGIAHVKLWGIDKVYYEIPMKPYHVNSLDLEEIISKVNDNGYGCEEIVSVDIQLYENYEGHLVEHSCFSCDIPNRLKGKVKRGI